MAFQIVRHLVNGIWRTADVEESAEGLPEEWTVAAQGAFGINAEPAQVIQPVSAVLQLQSAGPGGAARLIDAYDSDDNNIFNVMQNGTLSLYDADSRGVTLGTYNEFLPPDGVTDSTPILVILNNAFQSIFEVRADGSVHIKTGTSIIADL